MAATIDFSVLAEDASRTQVLDACVQARDYGFASVCVRPKFVGLVANMLRVRDPSVGTRAVKTCAVISFPLGTDPIADKVAETRQAIADGAEEIDWVFNHQNVTAMHSKRAAGLVDEEAQTIAELAGEFPHITFKVIIETYLLEDEQKRAICELLALNFDGLRFFLKTSTGFATARTPGDNTGATVEDVALMLEVGRASNPNAEVKASGGIKTLAAALDMIRAGATRLGMGTAGALAVMREAAEVGMD